MLCKKSLNFSLVADIYLLKRQLTDSLHNLQRILELTATLGQKTSALTTEANILRIQIEALIVVPGDQSVANRFDELAKGSENIKNEFLRLGS